MKILMQSRKNFFSLKGGDTVQLLKTKAELEKIDVSVSISLELEPDVSDYDVVHLSNITRVHETYIQMKNAKKYGKPVALSTIYWPMDEFEKNGQRGIRKVFSKYLSIDTIERIKAIIKFILNSDCRNIATLKLITVGYTKMQKYVLENADIFLPNSEMEMDKLCEYFTLKKDNYIVVPNAIDDKIAKECLLDNNKCDKFNIYKDAIICVGRIETRKNQLSLLKALENTNYKVLLVGAVSNNQKKYFKKVKEIIDNNPNYYYVSRIENDELYQLYKMCRVNALPSWYDTPGLVNLEAAAMGCNLAISEKGTTKEYFENYACYCNPHDLQSIRKSVDDAYRKDKNLKLQAKIFEKYTWKEAAIKTKEAYIKLVKER